MRCELIHYTPSLVFPRPGLRTGHSEARYPRTSLPGETQYPLPPLNLMTYGLRVSYNVSTYTDASYSLGLRFGKLTLRTIKELKFIFYSNRGVSSLYEYSIVTDTYYIVRAAHGRLAVALRPSLG